MGTYILRNVDLMISNNLPSRPEQVTVRSAEEWGTVSPTGLKARGYPITAIHRMSSDNFFIQRT